MRSREEFEKLVYEKVSIGRLKEKRRKKAKIGAVGTFAALVSVALICIPIFPRLFPDRGYAACEIESDRAERCGIRFFACGIFVAHRPQKAEKTLGFGFVFVARNRFLHIAVRIRDRLQDLRRLCGIGCIFIDAV